MEKVYIIHETHLTSQSHMSLEIVAQKLRVPYWHLLIAQIQRHYQNGGLGVFYRNNGTT